MYANNWWTSKLIWLILTYLTTIAFPWPYPLLIFFPMSLISSIPTPFRLPWWLSGKESICDAGHCLQCRRHGFDPWVRKIPWKTKWQPTPVFFPGKSHRHHKSQTWLRDWNTTATAAFPLFDPVTTDSCYILGLLFSIFHFSSQLGAVLSHLVMSNSLWPHGL